LASTDQRFEILEAKSGMQIMPDLIDSLWVRAHRSMVGAAVGAATFGVAAVIFLPMIAEAVNDEETQISWDDQAVLVAVGVAGFGGVVGWGIGRVISRWKLRYASDYSVALRDYGHARGLTWASGPTCRSIGLSVELSIPLD